MNFSADIETTRAPRLWAVKLVADRVQQVGLAAPGAAMDEQRVEADRVGGGQRPRGVAATSLALPTTKVSKR